MRMHERLIGFDAMIHSYDLSSTIFRFQRGLFANEAPDSSIHSNDRTCSTVAYENESRPSVEAIYSNSRIGISQLFTGEEVERAAGVTRRAIPMWRSERVRE